MTTNSTNRHPSYRWFLGGRPHRSPEKVNSLVYEDYTLVEYLDGSKSYVSPAEKSQLLLEGKLKEPKLSVKNEKMRFSTKDSDSDSCYEIPVGKRKPKSCDNLHESPKSEMRRSGSYPFSGGEISPGDNGIINLPPYLVPLETSLEEAAPKQKRRSKKNRKKMEADGEDADKSQESSSPDEVDPNTRLPLWKSETPEDAEVRKITEGRERSASETEGIIKPFFKEKPTLGSKSAEKINFEAVGSSLETPVEVFPVPSSRYSRGFSLPAFPSDVLKNKRARHKKIDPNPLKKMFGMKGMKKEEEKEEGDLRILVEESEANPFRHSGRYDDADLSTAQSDTESADHGSADKSSVSKLTSEKPPKKLMSGLFGSFRKGRSKDKVADNDPARNPSSFEITVKEQPEEDYHNEVIRTEGIVYAELDMARSPGSIMRKDDEKTEYAEIIYPGSKLTAERSAAELRKSRENLTSSRENLAEVDEAYSTSGDGKKEAAV